MKIKAFFFILSIFIVPLSSLVAQDRYIEVTGSAQMEIEPDEINLIIGIEEYWEEEFEKNKDEKDYRTKVPIDQIEDQLINDLKKAGISKNRITVQNVGNYWREQGKEFLISKQLEISFEKFADINTMINTIDTRGIKFMRLGEMNNSIIENYQKQVKIEAVKAARDKAEYLIKSLGEELGPVIFINELTQDDGIIVNPLGANTMLRAAEVQYESAETVKKIRINYRIKARFAIGE